MVILLGSDTKRTQRSNLINDFAEVDEKVKNYMKTES